MTFPRYASNFKVHFGFGYCFDDFWGFSVSNIRKKQQIPYLFVYNAISCIMRPPFWS